MQGEVSRKMQPYIDKRKRCPLVGTQLLDMLLYYPVFLEGSHHGDSTPLRGTNSK